MAIFDPKKYEGLTPELAAQIAEDVNSAHASALAAEKFSFKAKMDAMDGKAKAALERATAFDGIEPAEIEVLRKARGEAGELKTALEALKGQYQAKEQALREREEQLKSLDFSRTLANTVHQYNSRNPTVSVRDDAVDLIEMLAAQRSRESDGKRVFLNSAGAPIMRGDSYGGPDDFLEYLRSERPSLFNQPQGSGAAGSKFSPGSAQQISRDAFNKLDPAAKMAAIQSGKTVID